MALGDNYATLAEFKTYLSLTGTSQYDNALTDALNSASREIERHCGRQFNQVVVATAREYKVSTSSAVFIDDFYSSAGMIVQSDENDDGVYEVTWAASEYKAYPLSSITNGQIGWPQWKLKRVGTAAHWFHLSIYDQPTVQVTALWGWSAVPAPVKQSCLILAAMSFQLKDAPLGVAGMGEFGIVRVRNSRMAEDKLNDYCRGKVRCA